MILTKTRVIVLMIATLMMGQVHAGWNGGHMILGAEAGVATRGGDLNHDITHPAPGLQITSNVRQHDDTGFIFGFFTGYEGYWRDFLFGIEANLGWQNFGDDKSFAYTDIFGLGYSGVATFERELVIGLSGRVGYMLSPWMMTYVRIGGETSSDVVKFQSSRAVAPISTNFDEGRRTYRFLAGFGFEFPIIYNTVLRLEYNYSTRGQGSGHDQYASDAMTLFHANIKPNQHAIKLAWAWNFVPSKLVQ